MATDREQVKKLFEIALALRGEQLDAFLGMLEPPVREEVESLLAAHQKADSFLENPPVEDPKALSLDTASVTLERDDQTGSRARQQIGPYRILSEIGHGGMGVVYEAEQEKPVHRRVALKLIKWGMDTKSVIARFESERQALALMNHPNIANVYDAGATEQGRPFFAMELVHGEPITEYCDKNRLTVRERLDLFIQVCEGVLHAHQKGIIHRDIKPSNILITIQDDKPVPKIIDFGVAKATSQRLTEKTVYTELGQLIGTPEYMSPEQAEMTGIDIDTRTDVYSLGVVLYELLVGAQPFDAKTLRQASFDDMRRKIREEEAPKPSTRLSRLGEPSSKAARNRRVELRSLAREIRGELDWITMKALEKDRTRRYSSPSDLAADIQRHLSHEPVMAGPPSTTYRVRKFIRRHRIGVGAATALFATLIGFAVMMTIQSARIARERDRTAKEAAKAQAINAFLQETLGSANPYEGQGRDVTVAEALDAAVKRIDESFENQREIEAAVKNTIGYTYCGLGRYEKAEPLLVSALAARREMFGNEHLDVAESALNLGLLRLSEENYEVAENLYREALAIRRKLLGDEHLAVAEALNAVGALFLLLGETVTAEHYFHEALDIRRRLLGDGHPEMAGNLTSLALLYRDTGDYESSEKYMREVLAIERKLFGDEHPEVAGSLANLVSVLNEKGAYEAAEAPARESFALHLKLLGKTQWQTGMALRVLADTLSGLEEYQESEQRYRQAIPILQESLGLEQFRTVICRSNLGALLTKVGRYEEAENEVLFGFHVFLDSYGEGHRYTQRTVRYLIELYEAWGKPEKADEYRAMLAKEESE